MSNCVVPYLEWRRVEVCVKTKTPVSYPTIVCQEIETSLLGEGDLHIEPDCPLTNFYSLLGLGHREHLATQPEITRAYRKISTKFHPDRVRDKPPEEVEERYKCIQSAYDTLKDPTERRCYDSKITGDETIPELNKKFKNDAELYAVYGECFMRFAKWSSTRPVPEYGDANADLDDVEDFYEFWGGFRSWRDYSYLGEWDLRDAQNRDEKRWMEQQNKREAKGKKREEGQRISELVRQAQKKDPRWKLLQKLKRKRADEVRQRKKRSKKEIKRSTPQSRK